MSHFLFHLNEAGNVTIDSDGRDYPDAREARSAALRDARAIMAAEVKCGTLCLSSHIEVVDEATGQRMIVHFADALTVATRSNSDFVGDA